MRDTKRGNEEWEDSGEAEDAAEEEAFDVLIETPKGSRKKYEYDHERHTMRLDRRLASATVFPADYGYILDTTGNDGEELDALVLADEPTAPNTMVAVRAVGVFWLETDGGREAKIIAVPDGDPVWKEVVDIDHVPSHLKAEIENFFEVYKLLEPTNDPSSGGFDGKDAAIKAIEDARTRRRDT
ncbi:MAG: inorganic diphosphatase [Actinomycetota bacterium]|nr:inorganic diphosphatase [Actinomycetota bacterium]